MASKVNGENFKLRVRDLCHSFRTIRIIQANQKQFPSMVLAKSTLLANRIGGIFVMKQSWACADHIVVHRGN
jgi:hypothetical protein